MFFINNVIAFLGSSFLFGTRVMRSFHLHIEFFGFHSMNFDRNLSRSHSPHRVGPLNGNQRQRRWKVWKWQTIKASMESISSRNSIIIIVAIATTSVRTSEKSDDKIKWSVPNGENGLDRNIGDMEFDFWHFQQWNRVENKSLKCNNHLLCFVMIKIRQTIRFMLFDTETFYRIGKFGACGTQLISKTFHGTGSYV